MADAVIGALRVELSANSAQLEDGLKQASGALSSFARNVATIASGIGFEKFIEKSISAAVGFIKDGFAEIDAIGRAAQKAGVGVEALSGLQVAAETAGVSLEQLASGLGKLDKNMVDASKGVGKAKDTFDALGISVTDSSGNLKSADQVLIELSGKFANASDGAAKTADAIALLGKSGANLIPFLNEGGDSLERMREIAIKFGTVIKDQTAAEVSEFNKNITLLLSGLTGIRNIIIETVVPALEKMSAALIQAGLDSNVFQNIGKFIGDQLKAAVVDLTVFGKELLLVAEALNKLAEVFDKFPDIKASAKAFQDFQRILATWGQTLESTRETALSWFGATVDVKKGVDDLSTGTSKLTDTISSLKLQTAVARGEFANLATGFAETAARLGLTDKAAASLSRTTEGLTQDQKDLNDAMLGLQGAKIAQDMLPPWEKFEQQIQKVKVAFEANKLSADEFADAQFKLTAKLGQSYLDAASITVSGWANAFTTIAKQNKDFAVAAKAIAITQAIINTAVAVTKAFAELGPFGFIAAAGLAAAGAAQVALIAAQSFATGGSFRVGGGMTGIDSEMVSFRATPGEMVDIRRPGQERSGVQEITLRTPNARDFFATHVRDLVTVLNQAAPDGYKLKVAQ